MMDFLASLEGIEIIAISSLAQAVAFLTGELGAKRLSLICEVVPGNSAIALLLNPDNPTAALAVGLSLAKHELRPVDTLTGTITLRNKTPSFITTIQSESERASVWSWVT